MMAVKAYSMSEATGQRCSICGQPAVHEHRPFCSKRCADIDLARWLGGRYAIPGKNMELDEDIDAPPVVAPRPANGDSD
ncbi:MAG: DNA gyrase inhibitor YacG [Hyphomicrobium sp.]